MIQEAIKDNSLSRAQVGKWHKAFKEGREEVADNARSGRPSATCTDKNFNRVCDCLKQNRRSGVRLIAYTLNL